MNEGAQGIVKESLVVRPRLCPESPAWATYCPGCQEPLVSRIIADTLEELGVDGRAIMLIGVGCHAFMGFCMNLDGVGCCHGRAPDLATAMKRVYPNAVVFTIQGDGDCVSIGAGPLIGALTRGEKITIIMFNNANYGTTGGQLAPTTLVGQKTSTTPDGRNANREGYSVHTAELVTTFKSVAYSARGAVNTAANYRRTKGYVKTAFQKQIDNIGPSFVEILTACPPNWRLSPVDCLKWVEEKMIVEFPLGEFKNVDHIE